MKQQQERIEKAISLIKATDMIEKFLNKHITKELSGYQIPDFDKIINYGDDIGIPITFQLGTDIELLVPEYRTYGLMETHKMTFKERNKSFRETHQNALFDISATLIVDMRYIDIDSMRIEIDSVKFNKNCKLFKRLF